MAAKVAERDWDPQTLTQLDLAFHRAVGKATKNELIQRIYDFTLELFAQSIEETHRNERKGLNALRSPPEDHEGPAGPRRGRDGGGGARVDRAVGDPLVRAARGRPRARRPHPCPSTSSRKSLIACQERRSARAL